MKKRNLKHVDSKNNDESSSDEDDGDIFYDEVLGNSTFGTSEKPLSHISNRNISLRKIRSIESTIFKNSFLGLARDKADLASFYPLIQSDVDLLQKVSGRDFTIIAVNEILLKLSKRHTQHRFPSKEAFMSYMGKVLSYEMRDAVQISFMDFKLNCNRDEQEVAQQYYLEEIEYNIDISPVAQLRRKLAAVLEPKTAYQLRSTTIKDVVERKTDSQSSNNSFVIEVSHELDLSYLQQQMILEQVRAVGNHINKIDMVITNSASRSVNSNQYSTKSNIAESTAIEPTQDSRIWGKIRLMLVSYYGEDGKAIDRNWFSKLEPEINDDNRSITLLAPSDFIKGWVQFKYSSLIEKLYQGQNYNLISPRHIILKLSTAMVLTVFSASSLAVPNTANLIQSSYWYEDEDIRAVIKSRVGDSAYIAPALPFESTELVSDIVRSSVAESKTLGSALIPINFGNSHWAALAIKAGRDGRIRVIYNDSFGSPIASTSNGALVAQILKEIDPTIELIDLQVRQQSDGSSCGAFTAENLITIGALDISNMSVEELRNALRQINNAPAIRALHFRGLMGSTSVVDVIVLKPQAEMTIAQIDSLNKHLVTGLNNISSFTYDRLSHLNRMSVSGFASGDDSLNHGVWLKGFLGKQTDKQKSVGTNIDSKADLRGVIIGADTKLDDDSTIGIALSHTDSKGKNSIVSTAINMANISNNIFSLYGSNVLGDDLIISGNIAYGLAQIKIDSPTANISSTKRKATLLGGALTANYNLYSSEYLMISPRLGGSYNQLDLKSYNDGSIKINKTKQQEFNLMTGVVTTGFLELSSLTLMPEVSVDYSHGIWRKGNKQTISNQLNQTIISQKTNNSQGILRLGTGLTIASDMFEVGGGYERNWQGKSRDYMGYAKVRVNF